MSLTVRALNRSQVRTLLAAQLGCGEASAALHAALIADHIRTLIFSPHLRSGEAVSQGVHTSRIFAALDRNIGFVLSGERAEGLAGAHSIYEFVRDQLVRCGDIVHVGNGYWIPGPVRFVRSAASPTGIIIGGIPTNALREILKVQIHSIGPSRYMRSEIRADLPYPEETVSDWLGPIEPLAAWTEKTLTWAASQLQPQAEIDDDSIEIYAPDVIHARKRTGRWCESKEFHESAPMLRLFRPKKAAKWTFDRPDYLGFFNSRPAGAQLARSVRIPREMAFRLRFGFDQRFAIPRTIRLRRTGESYGLELKFGLPEPEAKVLGLAWRIAGEDDEQFFDALALPALNDVAALLGIRVLQD